MPVAGFAVFVSTVLSRGFGEHMQTRAHARVRCVACWRGVAGQHAATAGVHSAGKKIFRELDLDTVYGHADACKPACEGVYGSLGHAGAGLVVCFAFVGFDGAVRYDNRCAAALVAGGRVGDDGE